MELLVSALEDVLRGGSSTRRASARRRDKPVDLLRQQVERQPAMQQITASLKSRTSNFAASSRSAFARSSRIRSSPSLYNNACAGRDIAIHFRQGSLRAVLLEVVDCLRTSPAEFVNAGVDHQPHRAEVLAGELPKSARRILIDAELRPERLRVQRPRFTDALLD